uniref:Uncharacterized protein n=1 Tax=Chromera velia CCMP2878 TaxID=1169474 RepID=A0A0G4IAF7_9ALVE|mmetsp:Transcript_52116/g.102042  ORF Transcript_52116/g.102042 Transcript_52116/m.102042 type:complete len:414 (-) Transcript_52116:175-1416(-)|eukprot:Cvel_12534.t1-p1 / transcript=Cvel_12534.t1 / gene=Cvel_12534 / organism=Chromera_velia_CCMP2878 / gene_product=Transducin beta-like protein 2, putative / transcript_product=Transducin beta-like protein 2, putative / location=Cvel_scaffold823:15908-21247(+) / protein_length=413 / sequence_SO=supercontig / SO=protein_coding / is_pseudo=false
MIVPLAIVVALGAIFAGAWLLLFSPKTGTGGKKAGDANKEGNSGGKTDAKTSGAQQQKKGSQKVDMKLLQAKAKKAAAVLEKTIDHPLFLGALKGVNNPIESVAVSPDSQKIAVASSERVLRVYRLKGPAEEAMKGPIDFDRLTMPGSDYPALLDFTTDSSSLAVVSEGEQRLVMFDLGKPPKLSFHSKDALHKGNVKWIVASKGSFIVTCSEGKDTEVKFWSYRGDLLGTYDTKQIQNFFLSVSPLDARFVAVAAWSAGVKMMEVGAKSGMFQKPEKAMDLPTKGGVNSVCLSGDHSRAVCLCKDGTVGVFRTDVRYQVNEDPKKVAEYREEEENFKDAHVMYYVGEGSERVLVCHGRNAKLVTVDGWKTVSTFMDMHSSSMRSLAVAPDGTFFVTGGGDAKVRLWKIPAAN